MQPLPSTITTTLFHDAATGFQTAAATLGTADAAAVLDAAARLSRQGIPSLRMTTSRDSGSREVATALSAAADAAMALAKQMRSAPEGTDFSAHKDAILGWSNLAADAAVLVEPAAYGF